MPYDCRVILIVITISLVLSFGTLLSNQPPRAINRRTPARPVRDPPYLLCALNPLFTTRAPAQIKVVRPEHPEPRVAASPPPYDRPGIFRAVTDDPSPLFPESPTSRHHGVDHQAPAGAERESPPRADPASPREQHLRRLLRCESRYGWSPCATSRLGLLTCPCHSLGIMECTRPRFFMLLPAANPLRFDETAS